MSPTALAPEAFALLQRVHGHIALLGLAVLFHPVLTLGRRALTRGTRWTLHLAVALVTASTALGWWLYPAYRSGVKPRLIHEHPGWALAFETKEHLALFCLVLTWAGVGALLRSGASAAVRRASRVALSLAFLCGIAAAALGIGVAAVGSPAWPTSPGG